MKTFFSAIAILFTISSVSFAQLSKGSIHLAGSSDFSFLSNTTSLEYDGETIMDDIKESQFNFQPSVGFFAADNLALGLSFTYENTDIEGSVTTNTLVGPYIQYYFGSSNVRPFVRGDLAFGSQKETDEGEEFKSNALGYGLEGGVAIFIGKRVSLDFGLGYYNLTLSADEDSKLKAISNGFGIVGGISVYL